MKGASKYHCCLCCGSAMQMVDLLNDDSPVMIGCVHQIEDREVEQARNFVCEMWMPRGGCQGWQSGVKP